MDRYDLAKLVWEHSTVKQKGIPLEAWCMHAYQYQLEPIYDDDELIAAVMIKDNEVHIASKRKPKGSPRAVVRRILVPIINRWGYARTTVMADNAAGLAFCRRLGFVVEREEGSIIHLTIKEPRHA